MTSSGEVFRHHARSRLLRAIAVVGLVLLPMPAAEARDIRLGGTNSQPGAPPRLAPTIVELPTITLALRRDDGGWHHIQIDAWLASEDETTARELEDIKSAVVLRIKEDLPGPQGFEVLQSAKDGAVAAKEIIRGAAERSLGRSWPGDVLIRDMLVY